MSSLVRVWNEWGYAYATHLEPGHEPMFMPAGTSEAERRAARRMSEQYEALDASAQEAVRKLLSAWEATWPKLLEVASSL